MKPAQPAAGPAGHTAVDIIKAMRAFDRDGTGSAYELVSIVSGMMAAPAIAQRVAELEQALRDLIVTVDALDDGQLAYDGQSERDCLEALKAARAALRAPAGEGEVRA